MLQKFKITSYAFTVFCAVFMTLPVNGETWDEEPPMPGLDAERMHEEDYGSEEGMDELLRQMDLEDNDNSLQHRIMHMSHTIEKMSETITELESKLAAIEDDLQINQDETTDVEDVEAYEGMRRLEDEVSAIGEALGKLTEEQEARAGDRGGHTHSFSKCSGTFEVCVTSRQMNVE